MPGLPGQASAAQEGHGGRWGCKGGLQGVRSQVCILYSRATWTSTGEHAPLQATSAPTPPLAAPRSRSHAAAPVGEERNVLVVQLPRAVVVADGLLELARLVRLRVLIRPVHCNVLETFQSLHARAHAGGGRGGSVR